MRYSVHNLLLPDLSFDEQARLIADTGWDGMEIHVADAGPEHAGKAFPARENRRDPMGPSNLAANLPRLKAAAASAGVEICALSPCTKVTDPAGFEAMAAAAADLGAPLVRVTAPAYDGGLSYDSLLEKAVLGLESIEATAGRHGIKAVIEVHPGTLAPSASAARRMLEGFDPERVGVIFDPGSMVHEGLERWSMAVDVLGPYLAHVHAGNAVWVLKDRPAGGPWRWEASHSRMREGVADWKAIMDALRAAGYDGWVSLEDLTDQPARAKLADTLDFLKSLAGPGAGH